MRPWILWSKINRSFSSRTVFLNCCWSYHLTETVLRWFDHKDKAFYTLPYYFCILLYRSACIAATVFILHLYWHFYCVLELSRLVILFCTVGSVQGATCCGFQQGLRETHSGFLCGFLFCCGISSGLLRVAVRRFWVI